VTEPLDAQELIAELTPDTITGELLARLRGDYKMGRADFAHLCGYSGPARITNIEKHENWKADDRERVIAGLRHLAENPPKGPHGRLKGETGKDRAARLDGMLHKRGTHVADPPQPLVASDADEEPSLVPVPDDRAQLTTMPLPLPKEDLGPDDRAYIDQVLADSMRDVTNSEVGVWQRCRRKWWLGAYRGLALKQQDYMGYRAIGGRVHRALAAWYVPDGQERTDPRDALERAIVEDWNSLVRQVRQRPNYVDDETSLGDLSARFNDSVTLERAMVEGYVEWMIERGDDAQYRVTAPETEVSAVVEGKVADDDVRFRARALLDVRLTRIADGVRLFEDHKTVGNFAQKRKMLHMDPQMLHYHLLEWLNTPDGERRCDGALYNMLRRVKRTAQAKPPFYDRVEVHHNEHELDAYRRRLLGAARDIMRAERELDMGADPMSVAYPNPVEACSWDCDFFVICPMFDDGSRVDDAIAALYQVQDPMARYDQTRNQEGAI
jgi:hypothetical protein